MSDNNNTSTTYYMAELLNGGTRETIQDAIDGLDARWRAWADEASRPRARLILGGTFTLDRAIRLRCPIDIIGVEEGDMPTLELRSSTPYIQCFRFYKNEGVNDVTLRRLRIHGHTSDPKGVTFTSNTLVWRPSRIAEHAPIKEKLLSGNVQGWRVEGCKLWRCGIEFSRDYGFARDIAIIDTEIHDHEGIGILIEGIENVLIDNCTVYNIRKFGVNAEGEKVVRNNTFGCGIKAQTRHYAPELVRFDVNGSVADPPLVTATWTHFDKVLTQVPCAQTRHVTIKNSHVYNCEDDGIDAIVADVEIINCDVINNHENGIEIKANGQFIVDGKWVDGEWDLIKNARLMNNRIIGNGAVSDVHPHGANGIVCSVPGGLILGNVVENGGNDGIQVSRLNGRKSLWHVTVAGNRVRGNRGDGIQIVSHETKKTNRIRIVGNDVRNNGAYGMSVGKSRFVQVGIDDLDDLLYHQWADGSFLAEDGKPLPLGCCRDWMSDLEEEYAGWSNIIINNKRGGVHLQKSEEADIRNNIVQSNEGPDGVKRTGIDANQTKHARLRGNRCVGQEIGMSAQHAAGCRIEAQNELEDNDCNLFLNETEMAAFTGNRIGRARTPKIVFVRNITGADVSEDVIKRQMVSDQIV